MFITDLAGRLNRARVRYAVAGGYAVALNGVARMTLDVDLVVGWNRANLEALEKALQGLGLVSRQPISAADVFAFRKEYVLKRNLIAWTFYDPKDPSRLVDILIPHDLKGLKTRTVTVERTEVQVLERSELIKMKKAAGRPQDLEDVRALEARQ